jgi:fatty acid desaturase
MPLLAWSKKFLKQAPANAWYLKYQSIFFLPLLCFARLAWMQQSVAFVFGMDLGWGKGAFDGRLRLGLLEHAGLILHYVWYTALLCCMPLTHALGFAAISESLGGLLIGIAFGVGHNGMALYDHANPPPFGVLQISTTRNVHDNGFTGWFMGGLHYQIEHHLFPAMPRNSLAEAARRVKALCVKHDVPYHATGLIEGNIEVMQALDNVVECLESFPAM